jgi:hypothetical protein
MTSVKDAVGPARLDSLVAGTPLRSMRNFLGCTVLSLTRRCFGAAPSP